jgi:hypothetical protein
MDIRCKHELHGNYPRLPFDKNICLYPATSIKGPEALVNCIWMFLPGEKAKKQELFLTDPSEKGPSPLDNPSFWDYDSICKILSNKY